MSWGPNAIATCLTFVLAAILGKEAYGLVAMASLYLSFVNIFLEGGLGAAIVQRKDLEPEHKDAAFWITLFFSFVLMGLTWLISGWWAHVNRTSELQQIINVLAFALPLQGLTVVQESLLERKLDFKSLAIRSNISTLIGGVTGLTLALSGVGVWALVWDSIVSSIVRVVLLWRLGDWRPAMRFSMRHVRELFGFSLWVVISQIGNFIQRRSDALLVGLFFGPAGVGIYRLADRLINTIIEMATRPFVLVVLPHFARLQDNITELRKSVMNCIRTSTMITMPMLAIIASMAYLICSALSRPGRSWREADHVIQILALVGAARAVTLVAGPLVQSIGRPRLLMVMSWSLAAVNTVAFCLVGWLLMNHDNIETQAMGVAAARAVVFCIFYAPVCLWIMSKVLHMPLSELFKSLKPALISSAAVLAIGFVVEQSIRQIQIPNNAAWKIARLGVAGTIATGLAGYLMFRLDPGVTEFVQKRWSKLRARVNNGSAQSQEIINGNGMTRAAATAQASAVAAGGTDASDLPKSAIESRTST